MLLSHLPMNQVIIMDGFKIYHLVVKRPKSRCESVHVNLFVCIFDFYVRLKMLQIVKPMKKNEIPFESLYQGGERGHSFMQIRPMSCE